MGNDPDRPDNQAGMSGQFLSLRRRYHTGQSAAARLQHHTNEVQVLATWALRIGVGGWAMVREGSLKITNRVFDALDRDSVIGPGWHDHDLEHGDPMSEGHQTQGRTLAAIAIGEARGLVAEGKLLRRRRFGRGKQVVEVTVERSQGPASDPELVLVHVRDVSEVAQAQARLAETQERLRQREQIGRAGEVAMQVGHDLGNLVGALNARLMLMEAEGALPDHTLHSLKAIVEAQAGLIARLKSLARRPDEQAERVQLLDQVVKPAIQLVESTLQQRTRSQRVWVCIEAQVGQLPPVHAVRDALVNLVINLLVNARDAMPEGGQIRIGGQVSDGQVCLTVEDRGTGIPDEVLPSIFEPFFSTKADRGMGMGLAMARQLMRQLGGDIYARNRPEGGAAFELRFPGTYLNNVQDRESPPGPNPHERS
jgi:C4-dicarboxylate-specific signal transduction histidine kinase